MNAKFLFSLTMGLFGTIGLMVRGIPLPSSIISLCRAAGGSLFLLAVLSCKRQALDRYAVWRNRWKLLFCGVCLGFNWILLFEAYHYTTVATATLCYYCSAIFVVFLSPIVLKEKLHPVKAVCAAVAFAGMVPVSGVLDSYGIFSPIGVLFGLSAAVLYAAIVLVSKQLQGLSGYDTTVVQLSVSAIVLLPYVLLTQNVVDFHLESKAIILLLTVVILHTGVAYTLYFSVIRSIRAQSAALLSYLDPIVALLLSVFVLKEPMTIPGGIGAAVVLGALLTSELIKTSDHTKHMERMNHQ